MSLRKRSILLGASYLGEKKIKYAGGEKPLPTSIKEK